MYHLATLKNCEAKCSLLKTIPARHVMHGARTMTMLKKLVRELALWLHKNQQWGLSVVVMCVQVPAFYPGLRKSTVMVSWWFICECMQWSAIDSHSLSPEWFSHYIHDRLVCFLGFDQNQTNHAAMLITCMCDHYHHVLMVYLNHHHVLMVP